MEEELELSIVMPCLNESETLGACIRRANEFMLLHDVRGEVIVADNGSTDGSQEIAHQAGARVVNVFEKGYGNALMGGIRAAQGKYVVMGDADDSYDFLRLEQMLSRLRAGVDLVIGNRFKGGIAPGAMPLLHRYLGNPVLSWIGRRLFSRCIGDFHCGLRGFKRHSLLSLDLVTGGMEFASEMIAKAAMFGLTIEEVPTTLSKDGRSRAPHLRSWRDGWRHLRFMLLFSPRWLFFIPGVFLFALGGGAGVTLINGPLVVHGVGFDVHTLLYSAGAAVVGMQLIIFGVLARCTGACLRLLPHNKITYWLLRRFRLEFGLILSAVMLLTAFALAVASLMGWGATGFSSLSPDAAMREAIPAVTLGIGGVELMMASFWMTFLQFSPSLRQEC